MEEVKSKMLSIPLQLTDQGFLLEERLDKSIDKAISMLLETPCYSCAADPQYGFVFKNLRFEMFNENEGTVYDSLNKSDRGLYAKKVSGSSKNISTFALELQKAITTYEPRLSDVVVTMTYIREEKLVYVSIKGTILATSTPYQYQTTIRIWK